MNKEHVRFHFDLHDKSSMQCSGGSGWACLPLTAFVTLVWALLTVRYVNCSKDCFAGGRKGKAFLFLCLFHLQERRDIWGNKKCFQLGFDLFFLANNPVRSSTKFSILNLIVTHSVVLSGKYQAPKLGTWGVYCFGAHHSLILWVPQWWVLQSGLCCAYVLLWDDIVVLWQVLARNLMPSGALLDTHCYQCVGNSQTCW